MGRKQRSIALIAVITATLAAAKPAAGFLADMGGHWAAPLVEALSARGIISGDQYLRFNPEAPLTRAQLSKLLVAGLGNQDDAKLLSSYPSRFNDVPKWHWANGYIESLAEVGAIQGYPDGSFGAEDTVTRAQLAVIFVRTVGLADLARLRQFEQTGYADDAQVPDWARGAVQVARDTGLMTGFEDNTFRPLQPVTRAEGSVALFRLLSLKGRTFDLSGTLLQFDPESRTGTIRDLTGQDHVFTMASEAEYFRAGQRTFANQVQPLDQVWVVLGSDGNGTFMDARYQDLLAQNLETHGNTIAVTLRSGVRRSLTLEPGAPVFLNGRPVTAAQADKASVAYMALDRITGDVRVLDAVNVTAHGLLVSVEPDKHKITVDTDGDLHELTLAADVIWVVNGQKATADDLRADDRVQIAQNAAGLAVYVMAER